MDSDYPPSGQGYDLNAESMAHDAENQNANFFNDAAELVAIVPLTEYAVIRAGAITEGTSGRRK